MYALFSKSNGEGYKSLIADNGESLFCLPCNEYYLLIQLNELILNKDYAVYKKDENNFIVKERSQSGHVIFDDNKDLITDPIYIEPVVFGSGTEA